MRCTVVDYGLGNLLSVSRAIEHVGGTTVLADTPAAVDRAEALVLPGVGAFADGMRGLAERGLMQALRDYGRSGRPLLGICLGMQLLMQESEEFGRHEGLGLIAGTVVAIPVLRKDGASRRIPHIGWSSLRLPASRTSWAGSVLAHAQPGDAFYFVHSFAVEPASDQVRLAECEHDGHVICAAIQEGAINGVQFHPEKSGEVGLAVLRAFLRLA
jgi:glutamine amidotransferase